MDGKMVEQKNKQQRAIPYMVAHALSTLPFVVLGTVATLLHVFVGLGPNKFADPEMDRISKEIVEKKTPQTKMENKNVPADKNMLTMQRTAVRNMQAQKPSQQTATPKQVQQAARSRLR